MAHVKFELKINDLRINDEAGVDDFKMNIEADYTVEELVAYIKMIPELVTTLLESQKI